MHLIGLTGGIASGKTTVSDMLTMRGAIVIDADKIAREVVEPGTKGLCRVVETFGDAILRPDGTLDREALGRIVFDDPEANGRLRAIVHPEIGRVIAQRVEELRARADDTIVVLDAALLVETGRTGLEKLIVVAATPQVQVDRLVRNRGMTVADAEVRLRSQASIEEKIAKADIVIWNNGSIAELERRVDEVWSELAR